MKNPFKTKPLKALRAGFLAASMLGTAAPAQADMFERMAGLLPSFDDILGQAPAKPISAFDMRPQLEQVTSEIRRRLDSATPDRPLIVLVGQAHTYSAHYMFEQLLADRVVSMAAARNMRAGYSYEWDHDILTRLVRADQRGDGGLAVPPLGYLERTDPTGEHTAKMFGANFELALSPVAATNQLISLVQSRIILRFNDASMTPVGTDSEGKPLPRYLNLRDGKTLEAATQLDAKSNASIDSASSLGIGIRNRVIAKNVLEQATQSKVSVIIVSAGASHIFGDDTPVRSAGKPAPYDQSLYALFASARVQVLPVMLMNDLVRTSVKTPVAGREAHRQAILLSGLPEYSNQFNNGTPEQEAVMLKRICVDSGSPAGCYSDLAKTRPFRDDISANLPEWIKAAADLAIKEGKMRASPAPVQPKRIDSTPSPRPGRPG